MSYSMRDLDQILLAQWERLWLDPEWDGATGYARPGKGTDGDAGERQADVE